MGILIMPKGDGQLKPCIASLKIYNEKNDWLSNDEFKNRISKEMQFPTGTDGPFLIKKSEIARYFGLIEYSFSKRKGRITQRGKDFYKAFLNNETDKMTDIIINAIFTDSFGKSNYAVESSDSDIDPPKLVLRAIYDMPHITRWQLAYIIYCLSDLGNKYENIINYILKNIDSDYKQLIPEKLQNKYYDIKFIVFFKNINILYSERGTNILTEKIYNKYSDSIEVLTVYNTDKTVFEKLEEIDIGEFKNDIIGKVPTYSFSDVQNRNNRKPELDETYIKNNRYKTDYRISKTALSNNNYKCEYNFEHRTFKTKYNIDFVEAHHLIPMKEQKNIEKNIDRTENIVALCPTCHRAIHYANLETKKEYILKIYESRKKDLNKIGLNITYEDLLKIYGISITFE